MTKHAIQETTTTTTERHNHRININKHTDEHNNHTKQTEGTNTGNEHIKIVATQIQISCTNNWTTKHDSTITQSTNQRDKYGCTNN